MVVEVVINDNVGGSDNNNNDNNGANNGSSTSGVESIAVSVVTMYNTLITQQCDSKRDTLFASSQLYLGSWNH